MMKRRTDRYKSIAAALICAAACAAVLLHTEQSAAAVRQGLQLCGVSVLPSLFPMMFLAQYFVKSGGAAEAGHLLDAPTRVLFGLPGVCGAVILTGLVGGYPAGAAAAEALVNSGAISRRQGQRLANIAFCSGPGFTVGMVGAQLYQNKMIGLLILTAQALSCIIIGIASKILAGHFDDCSSLSGGRNQSSDGREASRNAFVEAASAASSAVLAMCGFIVLFRVNNALLGIMRVNEIPARLLAPVGLAEWGEMLLPCVTEVTGGSILSVRLGLPFTAFVVGFGGLSVHFQNFALCRTINLNKARYIATRIAQGGICAVLVELALRLPYFAEMCAPAAVVIGGEIPAQFSDVSGSFGALMLVMCLMSVICLPQCQAENN